MTETNTKPVLGSANKSNKSNFVFAGGSGNETEESVADKLFEKIATASKDEDITVLNSAVMAYMLATLSSEDEGAKTCTEIVALSQRLRKSDSRVRFVARTAAPPTFCARTHRNEPLPYYLQLANGLEEFQALLVTEQIDEAQNDARLHQTGLRVRDRHEERKKAPYLKLPADLSTAEVKEMHFNFEALQQFAPDVEPDRLTKHALDVARDVIGDHLCGTLVEVLRIGVPLQRWPEARAALIDGIEKRALFAQQETAIDSVKQDLIPLGFHALGDTGERTYATEEPASSGAQQTDRHVLVDLYAWQVRRFYIQLDQSVIDRLKESAGDVSQLLEPLAEAAGVATCQLESIKTLQDIERNFVITPLEK